jgi:hypothetical protein
MPGNQFALEDINQLVATAHAFQDTAAQLSHYQPPYFIKHSRSDKIQDALASILVHQTQKEAYAIGIHVDTNTHDGPVTIVVASNYEVPDSITDYLKDIWEQLRKLSNIYRQDGYRRVIHRRRHYGEYQNLIRKVYSHCFVKFKYRVEKHYGSMMELVDSDEFDAFLGSKSEKVEKDIQFVIDVVEDIRTKLEESTLHGFVEDLRLLMKIEAFVRIIREREKELDKLDFDVSAKLDRKSL